MTQRKGSPVATTRVSNKGAVTVRPSKPIVADAALEAIIHTIATNRSAAKELTKDADTLKKDVEREYWDGITETRPIMDAEGVMLAELKTIHSTSKSLDTFLAAMGEKLPFIMRTIEANDDYREAFAECLAAATNETTYCKLLTK